MDKRDLYLVEGAVIITVEPSTECVHLQLQATEVYKNVAYVDNWMMETGTCEEQMGHLASSRIAELYLLSFYLL